MSLLFHSCRRLGARDFRSSLGKETRAWFDHLVTGNPTARTTPEPARANLEITIAIERAGAVRLPLETQRPVSADGPIC